MKFNAKQQRERRGTLLTRTQDSAATLKRLFDRMMVKSTLEGENHLLQAIFSR
jgi:hypothetical protein